MAIAHDEMDCPCCGFNNVQESFLELLNEAQSITNELCDYYVPFKINSGCRCEKHNTEVGGALSSAHLAGVAADIAVNSSRERMMMMRAFTALGINRIGIGKGFLHVDKDGNKVGDVVWVYNGD